MKSIKTKLEIIHGLCDTKDISDWENTFIKSCWEYSREEKVLTGKQVEVIDNIYEKHFAG